MRRVRLLALCLGVATIIATAPRLVLDARAGGNTGGAAGAPSARR